VGFGDVSSITVNCGVGTFVVGGTVSGLSGAGLLLENNGGNDQPINGNAPSHSPNRFLLVLPTT
jgi:hypothetical protein